jgi:hypothetical protein
VVIDERVLRKTWSDTNGMSVTFTEHYKTRPPTKYRYREENIAGITESN